MPDCDICTGNTGRNIKPTEMLEVNEMQVLRKIVNKTKMEYVNKSDNPVVSNLLTGGCKEEENGINM